MARGDKSAYTAKQKRQAEHIEEGYENRGTPKDDAERIAWATVNKEWGGGAKSGNGHASSHESSRRGGEHTGHSQSAQTRSNAAKKGWETRRRHAEASRG